MGVIVRRPKGRKQWYVYINHKRKRKAIMVGSKEAALKVKKELEAKIALGLDWEIEEKTPPTFRDYAELWLQGHPRHNCKPGTYRVWGGILTHQIIPVFGRRAVSDITREDVRAFAYSLRGGLSAEYTRSVLSVLRMILNQAVEDELISRNPADNPGRYLPRETGKPKVEPFTQDELAAILDVLREFYPGDYSLFFTLARTGLRIGEALGLQWGDVNWQRGMIHVQRTSSDRRIGTPKSGKSRYVDMSSQLQTVLGEWQTSCEFKAFEMGIDIPVWMFPDKSFRRPQVGARLRESVWSKVLYRAGIDHKPIHTLRHTYASLLLQFGESIVYVRDQLGHSSIKLTADTYGHLVPGGNRAAVDKLDDVGVKF